MTAKPLPRSISEIHDRIAEVNGEGLDVFGAERSALLEALPWDHATRYLTGRHDHSEESWAAHQMKLACDPVARIIAQLPLAWQKANVRQPTAAQRHIASLRGLAWLCGDEWFDAIEYVFDGDRQGNVVVLPYYGKFALVKLSERVGVDWRQHDSNVWQDQNAQDSKSAAAALLELE